MAEGSKQGGVESRVCAARVIDAVYAGRSLSDALTMPCVQGSHQPFIQAICYGVFREFPRHKRLLGRLLNKPLKPADSDIDALAQAALYQIDCMRVPPHAAVNETVQAARRMGKPWASNLLNALLRRYLREGEALNASLDGDEESALRMPAWLTQRFRQAWPDGWRGLVEASGRQAGLTLRVNRMKIDPKAYLQLLAEREILAHPHPQLSEALMLDKALPVELLPGFSEGLVSVQDAGAQLAAVLLEAARGDRVLDACAAPGGKSCHLLERAGGELSLSAIDLDAVRLQRIRENLERLGLTADCSVGDASEPSGEWSRGTYQRILLDAPCSATGVIRRHPDIKVLRKPGDLQALTDTQRRCLDALWPLLVPGGMLLYATCSILPEENESQVAGFLERHPDARERPIEAAWGVTRPFGRQTLPGEEGMDGFYYACLEKVPG